MMKDMKKWVVLISMKEATMTCRLYMNILLRLQSVEMEAQVPGDGAEVFAAMHVQEAEMGTSVPDKEVQQEAEKLSTP
ncbi:hypothetical protein L3X38_024730 [Prunus dulcis]|uniref:Uncharacterized protein n=1 Tax=Prunus dulcis TaxID=3755 RepID=A0AAD4Z5Q2_PRUDU|nr:hypothetical protein L3X38_024730 [Prunus dulcis]